MARDTSSFLSLADLERLMEARRDQVEELLAKREQLQAELQQLDADINDFLTTGGVSKRRGRKRAKNAAPLRTVMLGVLGKNKSGLSLRELTQQIKDTGYKSHSSNFTNVVYQCLYNTPAVTHDAATGLYRVKK